MEARKKALQRHKERQRLIVIAKNLSADKLEAKRSKMSEDEFERLRNVWLQLKEDKDRIEREKRKLSYVRREAQLRKDGYMTTVEVAVEHDLPTTLARAALFDATENRKTWEQERVGKRIWWRPHPTKNPSGRLDVP